MATRLVVQALIRTFTKVNEDCKRSKESVVPLTDVAYYTEQIRYVVGCSQTKAKALAEEMSKASAGRSIRRRNKMGVAA